RCVPAGCSSVAKQVPPGAGGTRTGAKRGCPRRASALVQGLGLDGLVHHGVVVVGGHGGQHFVDGVLQGGVALLQGDADVDLLIADGKVALAAAEVQQLEVGVGHQRSLRGGTVGDDDVARAAVQGHQHGGGGLLGGQDVGIFDLGQADVIPDGAQLAGAGGAGQVGHAGGRGIGAVLLHQGDDGGVVVGVGEIHLLGALAGDGLACDDAVHVAAHDGGDQAVPVQLDDLHFLAQGLGDLLGHHDVVAVGVVAGIAELHRAVGVV